MAKKKTTKPDPPRFLLLAQTGSGDWPHPVEVSLHAAGADSIVGFSIGPHAANVGGRVPLSNVLDGAGTGLNPNFAEEFDAAELHWLVPFLVRLHAGEDVEADIESAYRERHGKWPASRP